MNALDYYFAAIGVLVSWPWSEILFGLKILSILISFAALYWYITTLAKNSALGAQAVPAMALDAKQEALIQDVVAKPWQEIQQKMSSTNAADWALAVIQADAILDKMLKASGYVGDTMGDRLKQINHAELGAIDDIWRAHKIRNRLAHGTAGITKGEADEAIAGYEKAFKELNYI